VSTIYHFIKQPGSLRIVAGLATVFALLLMALFSDAIFKYSHDFMDSEWIMQPPSMPVFKQFLVTKKGLRNLQRSPGVQEDSEYKETWDFLSSEKKVNAVIPEERKNPHLLGTDKDGRDILALVAAGAKTALVPGIIACLIALGVGIPLGLIGGYYGGRWADFIQFGNSVVLSFPRFVLILVVICAMEPNIYITMVVLGITIIPRVSELIRARVRILSGMGFILAAKESGLSDLKILGRHLFWYQNRTIFFVQASIIMAESILVETTLSYLQFGTKPPNVSWGNIIEGSRLAFFSEYYWITFFPAVFIVISILGFYYLGDGLNARMEYRERN
jgi:peptide/nickel transport system permease protein